MSEEQKEKQRERSRRYYYEHKEQVLARQKAYTKERYKNDEEYRQRVLDKNKKYEKEHYQNIKESKRKSQAKYMMKKREKGEAPITKDMIIEQLQQKNKQLKEQVNRLIKKEYEKDNNYIVKVRTGEQLEREQYLLNFKSKSMLASMLIDSEERISKAIELLQNSQIYNARSNGKTLFMKIIDEEIKILKGE